MPMTQTLEGIETIAARIRQVIQEMDWTQAEAAEHAGVDQSTVSHWVRARRWPEYDNLTKLAEASGRTVQWFYAGDEAPAVAPLSGKKLKAVIQARDALNALLEAHGEAKVASIGQAQDKWWERFPPHLQTLLASYPLDEKEAALTRFLKPLCPAPKLGNPVEKRPHKVKG